MNKSTLNTMAAGLMTCLCLSGLSESASAQFFSNDTINQAPDYRPTAPPSDLYRQPAPEQWQRQHQAFSNDRYLRTNAIDGASNEYRSGQGRCRDGQCSHGLENDNAGYRPTTYPNRRRGGQNFDSASRYQSRSAVTTGWDPSAVDPATGLPTERTHRHDHADGQNHRGRCQNGNCGQGQCDCPEGQCDCPIGQRQSRDGQVRHHRMDQQLADQQFVPASYDNFNQTRRNYGNSVITSKREAKSERSLAD